MKKIFFGLSLLLVSYSGVFALTEDTSIIDELNASNTKVLEQNVNMKTFESCEAFEDVMQGYFKTYWKNNYDGRSPILYNTLDAVEMSIDDAMVSSVAKDSEASFGSDGGDFSQTNTQVAGVDESDIIKTDGEYIYYYNETQRAVFISSVSENGAEPEIVKKIKLPDTFWNPQLYISENRLIIVASGYSNTDYSKNAYYINRNTKTYTIIFDTTDISNTELIKLYSSDGSYKESRRIGDILYVLSTNSFDYPYYSIKNIDDIDLDINKMLPQKLDIYKTNTEKLQNLTLQGKELPYNISSGNIVDCKNISYSFPDEETLKNIDFNPGYNIISSIDIKNPENKVQTKVIAGSNAEMYMSTENLYLTEAIYSPGNFSCPPNARCMSPFFWGGTQNTLLHKMNINDMNLVYQNTAIIPGSPLTQYSMDEYDSNFRIITSQWSPERSTGLYILDKNLNKVSSLENLAPGETFQSSRFIGDKLFLVTFEQVDPLFAIDVGDIKNPKILGELKIPGYSTYLHPYDENHLIGLGYDTTTNQWGGTQTSGIKVDLYKINYDKKCGDSDLSTDEIKKCETGDYKGIIVEQLYTKTIGGNGSYSEALNNPRMFIWNSSNKILLLPATLYERDLQYTTTDYYNGLFSLKIDATTGISFLGKNTHIDLTGIEEEREKECASYTSLSAEPVCKELLNGEIRCESPSDNVYVPNYCYKDSTIWQFIGEKSWNYNVMNIKRSLYVGDDVYGISDSQIGVYDWNLEQKSLSSFQ